MEEHPGTLVYILFIKFKEVLDYISNTYSNIVDVFSIIIFIYCIYSVMKLMRIHQFQHNVYMIYKSSQCRVHEMSTVFDGVRHTCVLMGDWICLRSHQRIHSICITSMWNVLMCVLHSYIWNIDMVNSIYDVLYILTVNFIYDVIHTDRGICIYDFPYIVDPVNILYGPIHIFHRINILYEKHVLDRLQSVTIDAVDMYMHYNDCFSVDYTESNVNVSCYALVTGKRKFADTNCDNNYVKFIIDSGCSNHISNVDVKYMTQLEPIHTMIGTAGSTSLRSTSRGRMGRLRNVLHTPLSKYSLLSVSNVCDDDITVVFTVNEVLFIKSNELRDVLDKVNVQYKGYREGNLYVTDIDTSIKSQALTDRSVSHYSLVADAVPVNRYTLWHQRLNHIGHESLIKLREASIYKDMIWDDNEYIAHRSKICHGCAVGKLTKSPTRSISRELISEHHPSNRPGGLILIDLFFSNITAYNSNELGLIIVDAYSKCMWATFGRSKDEAQSMLETWLAHMKALKFQVGSISRVRSDNGGEFVSTAFVNMLAENGIVPERAPPYMHVNRAERAIRHVKETARAYVNANHTNLSRLAAWKTHGRTHNPFIFWNEAVRHACYVFNVLPEKKFADKGLSRHERFFGNKPDVTRLKVFGSTGYVHVSRELRKSFDNVSVMGVYIGFNPLSPQTWRIMSIHSGCVLESRTVLFNENVNEQNIPSYVRGGGNSQEEEPDEYWQDSAELDNPEISQKSSDNWETVDAREESYVATINDIESKDVVCMNSPTDCSTGTRVPNTVREAKESPEWCAAYNKEIQSFVDNDILEFVPRTDDMKVLSWRWIFRVKENTVTGAVTHKARGTLRGDHQIEGVDYQETFAPVARLKSLRLLLSVVCEQDLECDNMDVDTAFLYGQKQEDEPDVFVRIPQDFPVPSEIRRSTKEYVGKLKRHVYGLKQAPRTWFRTLSEYLVSKRFVPCVHDACLFVRRTEDRCCYIFVYVDDLVIAANSVEEMGIVKGELRDKWSMKDLGPIESILGIRVIRDRANRTLFLSQEKYVDNLLKKFDLENVKAARTPFDPGCALSKSMCPESEEERALASKRPYRELVGSLMYLMVCTRPDIAFAICELSRYGSNHGIGHWNALMHVIRYVKGTKALGITFKGGKGLYPSLFSDASFASDVDSRRSVSGYISYAGGGPISWKSKLQSTTALSTCESEYIALCQAAQEAVHLKQLFHELVPMVNGGAGTPIVVFEDNKATIDISRNPCLHEKQKHVDVKYHYVRECVLENRIHVQYLRTDLMLADVLTKAVQIGTWMNMISPLMGPTDIMSHVNSK